MEEKKRSLGLSIIIFQPPVTAGGKEGSSCLKGVWSGELYWVLMPVLADEYLQAWFSPFFPSLMTAFVSVPSCSKNFGLCFPFPVART